MSYRHIYSFIFLLACLNAVHAQESVYLALEKLQNPRIEVSCNWILLNSIRDDTEVNAKTVCLSQEWETELRLRGRFRRAKCDTTMLPFRIQFKKKELDKSGYAKFRNHKIVTHCIADASGKENLMEELLVYKLYNILTDQSFKAIEATLVRRGMSSTAPVDSMKVLVLEPTDELAARVGSEEIGTFNLPADSMDAYSYNMTAMFEFMVGNFDWNHRFVTNVKLVRIENGKAAMIPHDFDFSGFVSASYTRYPPELGIRDPRDRVYLGEYFLDDLGSTEAHFISKKAEIYDYVSNFEQLKKARRKKILAYLDVFFDFIEDPEHVIEHKTVLSF